MAPRLKRIGFFSEFGFTARGGAPSLKDAARDVAEYDVEAVARYLRVAPMLAAAPGIVRDVFDPDASAVMTLSIKTDGVYEWPMPLAYYVSRYKLALPAEFLAHLESRGFKPPTRAELNLPGD